MGDCGGIRTIVHHEHLQFLNVADHYSSEAVRMDVAGLLVGTVPDAGHWDGALEATTNASIDTLWLAPRGIADTHEKIGLVPSELLGSLLDDCLLIQRSWTRHGDAV